MYDEIKRLESELENACMMLACATKYSNKEYYLKMIRRISSDLGRLYKQYYK